MEWTKRLNMAMNFIEAHITEETDFEQAAKIACCSVYHFQRMFAYMAGVPLSEYIRRRRMSLAAAALQSGDEKILDVALKYGYTSPTAFNRAFQSVHGVAPSLAKEPGVTLKSFTPISFKIMIKGAEEMDYRIEKKEAFRIVGISMPLQKEIEKNFETVPQMWGQAAMDGTIAKLCTLMDSEPMGMLGVSVCSDTEAWKYFIAAASAKEVDSSLEEYLVPAATWAVFPGRGTNLSIQDLEKRVITEWLPSSGYEYGNAPDVEVYLNADPQDAIYEVWVPVVMK